MRSGEGKIIGAGSGRRNSLFGQIGGQTLRRDIDQRRSHESYSDFPSSGLFEKTFSFFKSYDLIFRIGVGHSKHLLFEATQVSFASLFLLLLRLAAVVFICVLSCLSRERNL